MALERTRKVKTFIAEEETPLVIPDNENFLYRFVKPSHVKDLEAKGWSTVNEPKTIKHQTYLNKGGLVLLKKAK